MSSKMAPQGPPQGAQTNHSPCNSAPARASNSQGAAGDAPPASSIRPLPPCGVGRARPLCQSAWQDSPGSGQNLLDPSQGPNLCRRPPPRRRAPGQVEGLQGPKTTLRTPGGDPRVPQDGPREPQDGPREHPDGSRSFQDAQDGLQTSQDAPKTPQEASKMRPKRLPRRKNCPFPS